MLHAWFWSNLWSDRLLLLLLPPSLCCFFVALQPLEVLRPGMQRTFVVVEEEDEYGEIILSLAALEVRCVTPPPKGLGRTASHATLQLQCNSSI
jgi:hypothetical protein